MVFIILFIVFFLSVNGFSPLRKHHYRIGSMIDEESLLRKGHDLNQTTLLYSNDNACGHARLSCMAFSYSSSIPIRCGILKKAPLCKRMDPKTKQVKCDAFCDTDGGGRLCEKAFPDCCIGSVNGCISSKPRNAIVY